LKKLDKKIGYLQRPSINQKFNSIRKHMIDFFEKDPNTCLEEIKPFTVITPFGLKIVEKLYEHVNLLRDTSNPTIYKHGAKMLLEYMFHLSKFCFIMNMFSSNNHEEHNSDDEYEEYNEEYYNSDDEYEEYNEAYYV
jgi:hypothetical protein